MTTTPSGSSSTPPSTPKRRGKATFTLEPWQTKLVEEHLELVDKIVRGMLRRLPSHIDKADLIQQGRIGLMEAARRYDPTSAASFKTFATYRIRGEIIDGLRAFSQNRPEGAWNESIDAIGEASGRGGDDIGGFISSVQALGMAFNMATSTSENPLEESLEKQSLWQAVSRLPERERHVCELLYRMDMTMQDIADLMHTSKASVSRLHKRALERLRQDPNLSDDEMMTA
jgi:RNA polymerase sigma factor for flagellar operon FliA